MRPLPRRIKADLLRAYAALLKRSRNSGAGPAGARSVVIVTPASPGGLGDDALVTSLGTALGALGAAPIAVATHSPTDSWRIGRRTPAQLTLPTKHLGAWSAFLRRLREYDAVTVIGADMIDGHYGDGPSLLLLETADLAARMGLTSIVIGASFNGQAPERVTDCIRQLSPAVRLGARDPMSQSRLQRISRRPIPLVADIAFLLRPETLRTSVIVRDAAAWVDAQRRAGVRVILGCNLNPYPIAKAGRSTDEFLQRHRDALVRIHREAGPLGVLFLSHDRRAPHNDLPALRALEAMLPHSIVRCAHVLDAAPTAAEVKGVIGLCDVVLTGRMHVAIASLGSAVGVGCIGYQGKCEGLFRHFDLDGMVLDSMAVHAPGNLEEWASGLVARRAELRSQIQQQLPRVRALAWKNLDPLKP